MTALEEIKKALEGVTPGPWEVYSEKVADKGAAIAESAYQVEHTEPFVGEIFMLNGGGKCPAMTGCGPCSEANARYIAAVNTAAMSELLSTLESLQRENERLQAEIDRKSSMPGDHRYWEGRYRDEAAENEKLKAGIKRLSDEEELLAETTDGDMMSLVSLAAKLAEAEQLARTYEGEANQLRDISISNRIRAEEAEAGEKKLREVLAFYANPEIYKPHPHGPAFDRRDLSYSARTALASTGGEHNGN